LRFVGEGWGGAERRKHWNNWIFAFLLSFSDFGETAVPELFFELMCLLA
jgi:hypothetical protein